MTYDENNSRINAIEALTAVLDAETALFALRQTAKILRQTHVNAIRDKESFPFAR